MKSPKTRINSTLNLLTYLCVIFAIIVSQFSIAQQLAFPSAYGAGAYATGGRGGEVIHVTNLNDSGAGSLREALLMTVPRTIVFDVSGIINLNSLLYIGSANSNVTIAGQTAPEGGITIDGARFYIDDVDNIIVRHIRFKGGVNADNNPNTNDNLGNDSLSAVSTMKNQIFDHCTFSFGADESASWYATGNGDEVKNITIQKCLFAENVKGSIIGKQSGRTGASPSISFINNLFYNSGYRFPNIAGDNGFFDVINNVVWNSGGRLIRGDGSFNLNHIGNYYNYNTTLLGNTSLNVFRFGTIPSIYTSNNKIVASNVNTNGLTYSVSEMNMNNKLSWKFFQNGGGFAYGDQLPDNYFTDTHHSFLGREIELMTGEESIIEVPNDVGCNARLNADGSVSDNKDILDESWLNNVISGIFSTKLSTSQYNVPPIPSIIRPSDFYISNQHIPEAWYTLNVPNGQDHNDIAPSGYTWLEEYLNKVDNSFVSIAVESVDVTPDTADLQIPNTIVLSAMISPENATITNGEWTSSDESIATVDENGLVTPISPGVVEITFTSLDGGFTDSSTITVFPEALQVSAGIDQNICEGDSIILTVTTNNGTSFEWSTGETTQSIEVTPDTTTTYTVTVSRDDGETNTDTVTVTVNPLIVANAGEDISICLGESTVLNASGGGTYLWSTGETTASIEVNPSETTIYSVEVSNDSCPADTDTVTVIVNSAPEVSIVQNDLSILLGNTIEITAVGADSYLWNTGETTSTISVTPTVTTVFSVTGTSSTECTSQDEITITVIDEINANAGEDQTICVGETSILTASGGINYLWSTGETSPSITVSPTVTTIYSVTATDNQGNGNSDDVSVIVNSIPVAYAGEDQSICLGDSITLTASGGTEYIWSTGETTQSIIVSPQEDTTYTVEVFSDSGCSSIDELNVSVNTIPTATAGEDQTICEGDSIILTANGGTSFLWSTGETTQSITVNPSQNTSYSVEVFSNGCSDIASVNVTVNPLPIANAGLDQEICIGESVTLSAIGGSSYLWSTGETTQTISVNPSATTSYSVEVSNESCFTDTDTVSVIVNQIPTINIIEEDFTVLLGNPITLSVVGADSYLWNTGDTADTILLTPTETTTYSVIGTTTNGCSSQEQEITVTVIDEINANAGIDQSICIGESITLTASGGVNYLWNTGETTNSINVTPNQTTVYTVTATDDNGNGNSDEVTVTVNAIPIANAGSDKTICLGDQTVLTASGGANYLWSTGESTQSITVNPTQTRLYSVEVFANGCSSTDDVKVTVTPLPSVNAGNDVTIISGQTTILSATGALNYQWNTGDNSASINVTPTETTTYSVVGTTGDCSGNASVTVFVEEEFQASAGADSRICQDSGSQVTLTANQGSSYLWNTGETTQSIVVAPSSTTTYSVQVTSGTQTGTDDVTVFVDPNPYVVIQNGESIDILQGNFVTISASGANTYLWNNGATQPNIAVSPSQTTTYEVTGFINDCSDNAQFMVNVYEPVVASAGENVSICSNDMATLTATGGSDYLWSTGETTQSIEVSPEATTTYTVTVFNAVDFDEASVTVNVSENCNTTATTPVSENQVNFNFIAYPNPVDNLLKVKIDGLYDVSELQIFDITGKIVYSEKLSNEDAVPSFIKTVNVSRFQNGIYLLKLGVKSGNEITRKIIVN